MPSTKENVLYANTLQKLSEKISRLKNKGMYNASVRNTVLKLEARASALREATTANEARMTKLTAAISADREIISQKRAEIAAKRQSHCKLSDQTHRYKESRTTHKIARLLRKT